ncbi:hypothetical protein ACH4YO_14495 [Streptomyces noursei]|uniref:hypothetical protein n=1 Tax=Streptomyces noursei TaxID=1971 RepID=UPI00081C40E7|nr:hypothetical protein SNOUR_04645 [Streptomyces noursei ATCC 11455]
MTDYSLPIPFARLRAALDVALRNAEAQHGEAIALSEDYFWSIPQEELYDAGRQPTELTLGSLAHSWESVEKLPDEPDEALDCHLVWLSEILRAIGHAPQS